MKTAVVLGAGGFIGSHLVSRLKRDGFLVRGADRKLPDFSPSAADEYFIGDLRNPDFVASLFKGEEDEAYQLAAEMGGAGYIFSGEHDAEVMHNSALINLHVAKICAEKKVGKVFFSSSACIYPEYNQMDPDNPKCAEDSAYPAQPDSEYGWEKLFSERLFLSYARNAGLNVRIARFHNIFGPEGTWEGGREKAPAALCRKVAEAEEGGEIEIWGDGKQTRSFLYIDECLDGIRALLNSDFPGPVNIGSEEMISLTDFAKMIIRISGKNVGIRYVPGPTGVRGRNSDNHLIKEKTGWAPSEKLEAGISRTFQWISEQVAARKG